MIKNTGYKQLLMDWDGCLVDTLPYWHGAMKYAIGYFNIEASDSTIRDGFQSWQVFVDLGVPCMDVFQEKVYEYMNANLKNVKFNEGVIDTLISLKEQNIQLAVVTSTEREKVIAVLENHNMLNFFDCIVGRNDVVLHKPHPECIHRAIEILEGDISTSMIIGDSEVDIKAGKNAGITSILYSSQHNQQYHNYDSEIQTKPDNIIENFAEIKSTTSIYEKASE
jgi:pyrophosphatase PpaX